MSWRYTSGLIVVALALSGCAGPRARQELARLQSQVGLLDERITQLERSAMSAPMSSQEPMTEAMPATVSSVPAPSVSASQKAAAVSSTKPSTREIQEALKNAGFYQGAVDGKMGPITREAIREFQRVHGLTDDGVVGKQTWAKLRPYTDLSASASGELNAAEVLK